MKTNVLSNAKRNVIWGTLNKCVWMFFPFIEKTVVRYVLGVQILGLGGLFSSIISVLSVTELGFGSAAIYQMYQPVANDDTDLVNALLGFYRRVYRLIGVTILLLGMSVMPVLPYFIKGSYPDSINLYLLYLLYLCNTTISYFLFSYKESLLIVYQRNDIQSIISLFLKLVLSCAQVAILFFTKNYYYFVSLQIVYTIVNNLCVATITKKMFPQYMCGGLLTEHQRMLLKQNVAGTFIQKLCVTTRNSLDSICITSFLGLSMAAIYTNYYSILSAVTGLLAIISSSFCGGVGNHVSVKNKDVNYKELKQLDFGYLWISGVCTVCILCLTQPFMILWMGKDLLLPIKSLILFCAYFFLLKLGDIRTLYTAANGLYWENRFRAMCETVINLSLNVVLGKFFGVNGIIIATLVSLFLCNYLWGSRIVFENYFGKEKLPEYYSLHFTFACLTFVAALMTYIICDRIVISDLYKCLLVRFLLCIGVPNIIFYCSLHNCFEFLAIKEKLFKRENK